jgi:hypothetical protein
MSNIGLFINIKELLDDKLVNNNYTFKCECLDDSKDILIKFLYDKINKFNIDYPESIYDFEIIWFNDNNISPIFSYYIFDTDWSSPWEYQEIYDIILEMIHISELNNIHDIDKLYYDEEHDESGFLKSEDLIDIDETLNPDELEFKNKVLNIINKS